NMLLQLFLSQICRSNSSGPVQEMSEEIRRKFDQWWTAQFSPQSPSRPQYGPPCTGGYPISTQTPKPIERTLTEVGHPAMQTVHNQFPTQKTRMRTSFDPELELPKLQRWFADNQHPSRQQIQQYVKELNSLESRRGRKPLDINNVVYWFKNARAAQKRAEIRNVGPGLPCHLTMNGYSNHSPTNGTGFLITDGYLNSERLADQRLKNSIPSLVRRGPNLSQLSDEFSNAGSDLEDDDMTDIQPSSPIGPLSLTTNNRKDDNSRPSSPSHATADIKTGSTSTDPKEEPIDYHSPDDQSNNNKISDEEDDLDAYGDNKQSDGLNEESNAIRPNIQRICGSPDGENQLLHHRAANDGLERLAASFPLVPNSMFSHSIMYMSQYIPGLSHTAASPPSSSALNMSTLTADERRKRNRTFIDPVTEVPRLEQWFSVNTHPSHNLILKYTDELNCMAYRQKFPRLEPKNVQFWFKNRRAKCKRLKMSLFDSQSTAHYH
ncbi:Homeobox domain-containing protein, partial [Oryctes borbonicus]